MSRSDNQWIAKCAPAWAIPFLVPASIAIGLALGWWLDDKLGTKPLLAVVFTLLGLAAGIYESVRILASLARNDDE